MKKLMHTNNRSLLFFVSEDWYFALHFMQFAVAAKKKGFRVYLVCNTGQKGDEPLRQIEKAGIIVEKISLARTSITPLMDLKAFVRIIKLVKKIKPALIHAVALKPIMLSFCVASLLRIPMLAMITGLGYVFTSDSVKAGFARPLISLFMRLVAISDITGFAVLNPEDAKWAATSFSINQNRIAVVPGTGVDLDRFCLAEPPDGVFRLAYVGRMLRDKGIFELIDAVRKLKENGLGIELVMAGAPDRSNPETIKEEQLLEWQNEGLCTYLGHVEKIEKLLQTVNAVTLPSYREGLGMSLLEASACGLPCIATDVPGCRSAVIDNVTGFLVPSKNSEALYNAIYSLVKNAALRKKLGKQGRKMVEEKFASEIVITQMLSLYENLGKKHE